MLILKDKTSRIILLIILSIANVIALFALEGKVVTMNYHGIQFIENSPYKDPLKQFVYLSGAVKNPGIYEVTLNTRVTDVIAWSGGFTENVDRIFINAELNLAAKVKDEEHIHIPWGQLATDSISVSTPTSSNEQGLVSINTASLETLMTLPGIGESTASKIISARPFEDIKELLDISGIGSSKYDKIKDLVTL